MSVQDLTTQFDNQPVFPIPQPVIARITVLDTINYVPVSGATLPVQTNYNRLLKTDEQPYTRNCRIGEQWVKLDSGWLTEASQLKVSNEEGRFPVVYPTQEERAESMERVVEIGLCIAADPPVRFALIRPGESCRFEPADLSRLYLRCRKGTARVTVTVIPL